MAMTTGAIHETFSDFWACRITLDKTPQLYTPSLCANLGSGQKPAHTCPRAGQRQTSPPACSPQFTASLATLTHSNLGRRHSQTVMTQRYTEPQARKHHFPCIYLIRQECKTQLQLRWTDFIVTGVMHLGLFTPKCPWPLQVVITTFHSGDKIF